MCWGWCVDGRGWRAVVTYAVGVDVVVEVVLLAMSEWTVEVVW